MKNRKLMDQYFNEILSNIEIDLNCFYTSLKLIALNSEQFYFIFNVFEMEKIKEKVKQIEMKILEDTYEEIIKKLEKPEERSVYYIYNSRKKINEAENILKKQFNVSVIMKTYDLSLSLQMILMKIAVLNKSIYFTQKNYVDYCYHVKKIKNLRTLRNKTIRELYERFSEVRDLSFHLPSGHKYELDVYMNGGSSLAGNRYVYQAFVMMAYLLPSDMSCHVFKEEFVKEFLHYGGSKSILKEFIAKVEEIQNNK